MVGHTMEVVLGNLASISSPQQGMSPCILISPSPLPTFLQPSWNPPAWVFGPVWTALYSAMGYASWRVWQAGGGQLPLGLYAAQLALNFAWSPLFFGAKALGVAAVDITALVGMVAATIYEFQKVDPVAAQLLYPYLAWVTFAAALNYNLAANNPSGQVRIYVE